MPSKLGFGNSRTPMTKKASYGSALHYKNPIKKEYTEEDKRRAVKMSKEHEGKPGFNEWRDKVMGGKTTVKGSVSTVRKPAKNKK
jgi:hypothetical protein